MTSANKNQLRISGKNLGMLALADACPRCFWFQLKMSFKSPFSFFPGIFSSIDSYTKNVVHAQIRSRQKPAWLAGLGVVDYRDPPHFSKFNIIDREHNILLTGSADGIFVRGDGSHIIVDYKTAKLTDTQDELFPVYEVQLNCYARIAEQVGFSPVSGLILIYMEPLTDGDCAHRQAAHATGFDLAFVAKVKNVQLNPGMIDPLLQRARHLYNLAQAPAGRNGCKNCGLINELVGHAGGKY